MSDFINLLDKIMSGVSASMVTAAIAVIIAFWNGHAMRRHYRLSVRPRLKLSHRFRGSIDYYGIRLINAGLGPALIENITITVDDEPIENTHHAWKEIFITVGLDPSKWHLTRAGIGSVMRVGEEIWLFRTDQLEKSANCTIKKLSRVNVTVSYSSMYGEKQKSLEDGLARHSFIIESEINNLIEL